MIFPAKYVYSSWKRFSQSSRLWALSCLLKNRFSFFSLSCNHGLETIRPCAFLSARLNRRLRKELVQRSLNANNSFSLLISPAGKGKRRARKVHSSNEANGKMSKLIRVKHVSILRGFVYRGKRRAS